MVRQLEFQPTANVHLSAITVIKKEYELWLVAGRGFRSNLVYFSFHGKKMSSLAGIKKGKAFALPAHPTFAGALVDSAD